MDKRGQILVLFIFTSFLLIPSLFAQTQGGCCATSSQEVCPYVSSQSECDVYGGTYNSGVSCPNTPGCELVCKVCEPRSGTTGISQLLWGTPITGCEAAGSNLVQNGVDLTKTQDQCQGTPSSALATNLPDVEGSVKDGTTPIVGAMVWCTGSSTTSVSNGYYKVENCSIGTNVVYARFGTKSGNALLSPALGSGANAGETLRSNVNIQLLAGNSKQITIRARNSASPTTPVTASITIQNNASGFQETKSGTDVIFNVKPEIVLISAYASGFKPIFNSVDFTAISDYTVLMETQPTITLSGFTLDNSVTPNTILGGVLVKAVSNSIILAQTTTGNDGSYSLNVPSSSSFSLIASKTGYSDATISNLIYTSASTKNISLSSSAVPTTATVNVLAKDQSSNPISGVRIRLGQNGPIQETGADGKTVWSGLSMGSSYTFYAHADNYNDVFKSITIVSASSNLDITLTSVPTMILNGNIIKTSCTTSCGISGSQVVMSDGSTTTTDSNGAFTITRKVTNKVETIYVTSPGYLPNTATIPSNAGSGGSYGPVQISLTPALCNDVNNLGDIALNSQAIEDTIKITWSASCPPPQNQYTVLRKLEGEQYVPVQFVTQAPFEYNELNAAENKTYCFKVTATYSNFGGIVKTSNEQCVNVGFKECFSLPSEFCSGNTRITCTNRTNIQPLPANQQCSSDQICVRESQSVTRCLSANQCDLCNRPFGVFSQSASFIQYTQGALFGGIYRNDTNVFDCSVQSLISPQAVGCYLDSSKTVVDKYDSCADVKSCYDYNSAAACGQKKCTPSLNCQWSSYSNYSDFRIGVCKPVGIDSNKQDCAEFNNALTRGGGLRDYIFNKVFSAETGNVAKELCSLYGDACFYKASTQSCLNKDQVTCYDYGSSQSECEGAAGQSNPVNINVTWGAIPGQGVIKKSGSNKILQRSNDAVGIGLCRFTNTCIKDADKSLSSDCDPSDASCGLDVSPPNTSIDYTEYVNSTSLSYTAVDDKSSQQSIRTYSHVIRTTLLQSALLQKYPYQSEQAQNGKTLDLPCAGLVTPSNEGDNCTMLYFSEDSSHNLEEVKKINFILDTVRPNITATYSIKPYPLDNKVDLTVNLKLGKDFQGYCVDSPELGLCVQGRTCPEMPFISTIGIPGNPNEWSATYREIPTGDNGVPATFSWRCYDKAGNKAEDPSSIQLSLDADGIISNPSLVTTKSGVPVPIYVHTQNPGSCRYIDISQTGKPFDQWTPFDNVDTISEGSDYKYSSTIPSLSGSNERYRFKVKCNLTDVSDLVEGRDSDDIRITIDDKPPVTQPYTLEKGDYSFTNPQWLSTPSLRLRCADAPQGDLEYPHEIGCLGLSYCLNNYASPAETPCTLVQSSPDVLIDLSGKDSAVLSYSSSDKLGNVETGSPKQQLLLLDYMPPVLNLNYPLNTTFIVQKEGYVTLSGFVNNLGPDGCVGSSSISPNGCLSSPLSSIYYELRYRTQPTLTEHQLNETIQQSGYGTINIPTRTIVLKDNKVNELSIIARDQAGNPSSTIPIVIVHDSLGPNISQATINGNDINSSINVPFGQDYDLSIGNLKDIYPDSADLFSRVDSVWVKDMFGAKYNLHRSGTVWVGKIKTGVWPITTSAFRTFITVFANDTLGNPEEKPIQVNIVVKDTTPPVATYKFENSYGENVNQLVKGLNYMVLQASETLDNLSMNLTSIDNPSIQYKVRFVARDFDAVTWIGIINVTDTVTPLRAAGIMYDSNGLNSSDFTHISGSVNVDINPLEITEPIPLGAIPNDGIYYVIERPVIYSTLGFSNQFNVNGVISTSNPVSGLNLGINDVTIRVEDDSGNYKIFNQKVFVNSTSSLSSSGDSVLNIVTKPLTNADPLYAEVHVSGGSPVSAPNIFLDGNSLSLTKLDNGSYYYKQTRTDISEGAHTITSVVTSQGPLQVSASPVQINVDRHVPGISSISANDLSNVKLIDSQITSRNQTLDLVSYYNDSDISEAYVIGDDGAKYSAVLDTSTQTFSIHGIRLVGRTFTETQNTLTLVLKNTVGNTATRQFSVTKDLLPPQLIKLAFIKGIE